MKKASIPSKVEITRIYNNGFIEFIKMRLNLVLKANKIIKKIDIKISFTAKGTKGTIVNSMSKIKAITCLEEIIKGLFSFIYFRWDWSNQTKN